MDPIFLFPSPGGLGTFSGLVKLSYFAYNIVWLYLPVMLDDLLLKIKSEVHNRSRKKNSICTYWSSSEIFAVNCIHNEGGDYGLSIFRGCMWMLHLILFYSLGVYHLMEVSSEILIGAEFFITHDFNDLDKKNQQNIIIMKRQID